MERLTSVWTGFGPFLDYTYNPSWDVAQAGAEACGCEAHLLEVSFEAAEAAAGLHRAEDGPALIVHLGLAAARPAVSFERFAHNVLGGRDDRPDGTAEDRDPLDNDGPLALETPLMLGRLVDLYNELRDEVLPPGRVSRDAGTYVCNATYYHSLAAHTAGHEVDVVFVHVPSMEPEVARRVGRVLADTFLRYYSG